MQYTWSDITLRVSSCRQSSMAKGLRLLGAPTGVCLLATGDFELWGSLDHTDHVPHPDGTRISPARTGAAFVSATTFVQFRTQVVDIGLHLYQRYGYKEDVTPQRELLLRVGVSEVRPKAKRTAKLMKLLGCPRP